MASPDLYMKHKVYGHFIHAGPMSALILPKSAHIASRSAHALPKSVHIASKFAHALPKSVHIASKFAHALPKSVRLRKMPDKASLAGGLIAAVQLSDQTIVPGKKKSYCK